MPPKFKRSYDTGGRDVERQSLLDGASDDDDFFINGPTAQPSRLVSDAKMTRLQGQVDDVVDIMQTNIGRVLDRGERLDDLQDKSESLSVNADVFRVRSRSLKQQMWWKECKMRVLIAVVVVVILAIIIIPIIIQYKKD